MNSEVVVAGIIQILGLVLAPLAVGVVSLVKARLQGRRGAGPLQPYRELRRIWRKSSIMPGEAGTLYRAAPAVITASLVPIFLLVPVAGVGPSWGLGNDALVLVGLLALARLAIALAAWDTGTGFGLMGASRDLMVGVFAEGVLLLVVLLAAIGAGGSTDLIAMSNAVVGSHAWSQPIHWCAAFGFALVALAETGRQPIDNPDTHLELTMIHEGPLLEYGGRDLAFLHWASAARFWLMAALGAALFAPAPEPFPARVAAFVGAILVLSILVAMTETVVAKMRILRIPLLLGAGAAICLIGLASRMMGAGG